jgi:phosphocarrier protein HPr
MEGEVQRRVVAVCNPRGLHTRTAARFARLAGSFRASVTVEVQGGLCDGIPVSGTSVMGLLMLGARPGSRLILDASGADAAVALTALCALVERGFDERVDE